MNSSYDYLDALRETFKGRDERIVALSQEVAMLREALLGWARTCATAEPSVASCAYGLHIKLCIDTQAILAATDAEVQAWMKAQLKS